MDSKVLRVEYLGVPLISSRLKYGDGEDPQTRC